MLMTYEVARLYLEHGIDLCGRNIYMGYGRDEKCDLDEKLTADVVRGLHILEQSEGTIYLHINCQGGYQQHGFAIYDTIQLMGNKVVGIATGYCLSMAVWVLQGCDIRLATPNSSIMIHDGPVKSNPSTFEQSQDEYSRLLLLSRIREKHPDFSKNKLMKMLRRDTYFTTREAIDIGLLDGIVGEFDITSV